MIDILKTISDFFQNLINNSPYIAGVNVVLIGILVLIFFGVKNVLSKILYIGAIATVIYFMYNRVLF